MDLHELSNVLEQLGSPHEFFVQWLPDSDHVYHYTDLAALGSIATNHDLWLTDSRFSNDSDEMEHGLGVVTRTISNRLRRTSTSAEEKEFLRAVQTGIRQAAERAAYISCFCRRDDLLGQWRGYAQSGTGVSVWLSTDGFWYVTDPDGAPSEIGLLYLWRVFYRPQKQVEIVDDCLSAVWNGPLSDDAQTQLAIDALRFFVPTFKGGAFADEHEARLVFIPTDNCPVKPRFRMSRGMLVPYFSLQELAIAAGQQSWRLPIVGVTIGPSPLQREHARSVRLLLEAAGYESQQVDVSKTPFRG